MQELTLAKERLRYRKSVLSQCYAHAGYWVVSLLAVVAKIGEKGA